MKKHPIESQNQYYYIGRLLATIAKKIEQPAGRIYIDDNHLKHVFSKHKSELKELGLTPKIFVDLVVNNFNRIYKGTNESLLLVLRNGKPKVTAIELNFALKKEFYEVKTATVMSKDFFKYRKVLWEK